MLLTQTSSKKVSTTAVVTRFRFAVLWDGGWRQWVFYPSKGSNPTPTAREAGGCDNVEAWVRIWRFVSVNLRPSSMAGLVLSWCRVTNEYQRCWMWLANRKEAFLLFLLAALLDVFCFLFHVEVANRPKGPGPNQQSKAWGEKLVRHGLWFVACQKRTAQKQLLYFHHF